METEEFEFLKINSVLICVPQTCFQVDLPDCQQRRA